MTERFKGPALKAGGAQVPVGSNPTPSAYRGIRLQDCLVGYREPTPPTLSGAAAFRLHDTYGFPIELTLEICRERGIAVNFLEFAWLMAAQKARSKRAAGKKVTLVPCTWEEWKKQHPQFQHLNIRRDGIVV